MVCPEIRTVLDTGVLLVNILVMLTVGMELEAWHFRELAARKGMVAAAIGAQILFLPLLGVVIVFALELPAHLAAGVLLLAASPVGSIANLYTLLARANVALSVSLDTLSCMLSFLTMAVIFESYHLLLGKAFEFPVPALALTMRLTFMVLLPVVAGMVVRRLKPELSARHTGALRKVCLAGVAFMVVYVVVDQRLQLAAEWEQTALAGALFITLALLGGAVFGWVVRLSSADCATVSTSFAVRNVALATTIAVTVLNRIEYALFTTVYFIIEVPLVLTAVALYRRRCTRGRLFVRWAGPGKPLV